MTMWQRGEIIRRREDGHPFLVVHVHKGICSVIVDLEDKRTLPSAVVLLPRDYEEFAPEEEMDEPIKNRPWQYHPIQRLAL